MTSQRMSGVLSPVVTPFSGDLSPDADRLARQCQWLLSQNVGLAIFGTNSEANSLSVDEKIDLMDALVDAGVDPARMMPGTGCCALTDSVRMTAHAAILGCGGTLMLPPFYYKGVSDDGLYASYAEVIQRVGNDALQIYLYHIPPIAQVGLSVDLIDRLVKDFPDTVVGIKDSSGDWNNLHNLLTNFPSISIFAGTEKFLVPGLRLGGAGIISAMANVIPGTLRHLYDNWLSENADTLQEDANHTRSVLSAYPTIPALKGVVSHQRQDEAWRTVRPPLVALSDERREETLTSLGLLEA